MQFLILLAVVASAAAVPGIVNTGASAVSRSDDGLGNYAFGYNEDHATGGSFRKEKGGPGVQVGSYGLRDADGRVRTVNYVADALGFRASISTNEPGVDPVQPAAATTLNGAVPVAPGVAAYPAPVIAKAAYAAAPVAAYAAPIAPVAAYAAAPVAIAAPIASSYSVATQHVSAAPAVAVAAPVAAYAAPVAIAAPLASSYSVATQHLNAAPLVAKAAYGVGPIGLAAPIAAGPIGYGAGYGYSTGPIIGAAPVAYAGKAAYGAYGVAPYAGKIY